MGIGQLQRFGFVSDRGALVPCWKRNDRREGVKPGSETTYRDLLSRHAPPGGFLVKRYAD